jgi:hypothetical protein
VAQTQRAVVYNPLLQLLTEVKGNTLDFAQQILAVTFYLRWGEWWSHGVSLEILQ